MSTASGKRIWIPTHTWKNTSVVRWEWTRRGGLIVVYSGGLVCRSAWGTLREFLKAILEGRENAREAEITRSMQKGENL